MQTQSLKDHHGGDLCGCGGGGKVEGGVESVVDVRCGKRNVNVIAPWGML